MGKPVKMWAVVNSREEIIECTVSEKQNWSIQEFMKNKHWYTGARSWADISAQGYKCVRVTVRVE